MSSNILFVGADSKGSWTVRGVQMAGALGARATQRPTRDDWRWADVVILVKRAIDVWGETARATHLPIIWDALDFWKQPEENSLTRDELIAEVQRRKVRYGLTAIIGATRAMASDVGGIYIPHHYRPGLHLTPPRDSVKVVAYEGTPKYLGVWRAAIEHACQARGLRFVVNPRSLSDADVIVAFRDGKWDGWACREWKSGVKCVNALAVGRPVITQPSAAVAEIRPEAVAVTGSAEMFGAALDRLIEFGMLRSAHRFGGERRQEFAIETIANQYRALISNALKVAA